MAYLAINSQLLERSNSCYGSSLICSAIPYFSATIVWMMFWQTLSLWNNNRWKAGLFKPVNDVPTRTHNSCWSVTPQIIFSTRLWSHLMLVLALFYCIQCESLSRLVKELYTKLVGSAFFSLSQYRSYIWTKIDTFCIHRDVYMYAPERFPEL